MIDTMQHDFDHRILDKHAFGLMDPSMLDELPPGMTGTPLAPAALAGSSHLMPRLLEFRTLPEASATALLHCLHRAHTERQAPPIRMLVETQASAAQFTRHWNAMQLVSPRSGEKCWLRLHDPRVLHQLVRMLSPAQHRVLLGSASALTYWIGDQWVRSASLSGDVLPPGAILPSSHGAASHWDWPRIGRIGMINRALQRNGVHSPDARHRQADLAEQLMARAQAQYGLTSNSDLVEFVFRGLSASPDFDQHPDIAALIQPDANDLVDDSTLSDRLALIDAQIWHELHQLTTAPYIKAWHDRHQKLRIL